MVAMMAAAEAVVAAAVPAALAAAPAAASVSEEKKGKKFVGPQYDKLFGCCHLLFTRGGNTHVQN